MRKTTLGLEGGKAAPSVDKEKKRVRSCLHKNYRDSVGGEGKRNKKVASLEGGSEPERCGPKRGATAIPRETVRLDKGFQRQGGNPLSQMTKE